MTDKIEIRTDDDGIDEIIMPGVHLEMLDDDQAYLALYYSGVHMLIDITAEVADGKPQLNVTVAERWEGGED